MAYKKANRDLTDEQFSENTTIDGTRIDKAIGDVIETHNRIPKKNIEAIWMPTTYVACWSPARPFNRWMDNTMGNAPVGVTNGGKLVRYGPNHNLQSQNNWFPFLASHNAASEVFPSDEQPPNGFDNEYRVKGYYVDPLRDEEDESISRVQILSNTIDTAEDFNQNNLATSVWYTVQDGLTLGGAARNGLSNSSTQTKYFTATFPFYFHKPVIVMSISIFAAQEHPVSYFNSGVNNVAAPATYTGDIDGLKGRAFYAAGTVPLDHTQYRCDQDPAAADHTSIEETGGSLFDPSNVAPQHLMGKTGNEFPGEYWTFDQSNIGAGTIQISIDNTNMPEQRELNNVVFNKTDLGNSAHRFNRYPTTNSTAGHSRPRSGGEYIDMVPAYPGGSTWGVWIKEDDLNIPIPEDSRVRFSITNKGFRAGQLFEWNIALTVLEMVED